MHCLLRYLNKNKYYKGFKKRGKYIKSPKKGTIYVVRLMKTVDEYGRYTLGIAKPCLYCQTLLSQHNIKTIKYTDVTENGEVVICEMRLVI